MSEPKRLLDAHDSSPEERALLRAGLADQPDDAGKQQLLALLGLPALPHGAHDASLGSHAPGIIARAFPGKVLLVGALMGAVGLGTLSYVAVRGHDAARAPHDAPAHPYKTQAHGAQVAAQQEAQQRDQPDDSLAREVAQLDAIRSQLAHDAAASALAKLDQYAQAHPRGVLQEEAGLLRIQALSRLNMARARTEATRFLTRYPSTAHRARIRALLANEPE